MWIIISAYALKEQPNTESNGKAKQRYKTDTLPRYSFCWGCSALHCTSLSHSIHYNKSFIAMSYWCFEKLLNTHSWRSDTCHMLNHDKRSTFEICSVGLRSKQGQNLRLFWSWIFFFRNRLSRSQIFLRYCHFSNQTKKGEKILYQNIWDQISSTDLNPTLEICN